MTLPVSHWFFSLSVFLLIPFKIYMFNTSKTVICLTVVVVIV